MKKRAVKWMAMGLILIFCCCACQPVTLLNERVILQYTGTDRNADGIQLTACAFLAAHNDGDGGVTQIRGYGETITEAAQAMALTTGGQPYFSHNRAVILGRETAVTGIASLMTFFAEYRECRGSAILYVAETDAAEMMEKVEKDPGLANGLDELARTAAQTGNAPATSVWQAAQALSDSARDFCLPYLVAEDDVVSVSGCAVFSDDRMVCVLSEEETKGLLITRGELTKCVVTVETQTTGRVTLDVCNIQADILLNAEKETPEFCVSVECSADPVEWPYDAQRDSAFYQTAIKACEAEIQHWIRSAISTALRQNGSDPFSFGRVFRREAPSRWQEEFSDWRNAMKRCSYRAEVSVQMDRL